MAHTKGVKQLIAVIETEGIEVLSADRKNHVKFVLRYNSRQFVMVTGWNNVGSDQRKMVNFRGDLRNIKRAIDTGDETLLRKYLGVNG